MKFLSVFKIQYNIVTHCSPLKKPCGQNMIAGRILTDMAAFLEKASQDPRNALSSILGVYPTDPLDAVPVGAHFTRQIRPNALLSNPSSILNYSQARIVGLRNTYGLPRAAADAVMEMVSDPKFVPREIGTKYVKKLEKKLLKGFDGGDVSVFDMHEEMDGKQDVRLFLRMDAFLETRPLQIPWSLPFIPSLMKTANVGWGPLWAVHGAKFMPATLDPTKFCSLLLFLLIRAILG